jgi:hypothetical protein
MSFSDDWNTPLSGWLPPPSSPADASNSAGRRVPVIRLNDNTNFGQGLDSETPADASLAPFSARTGTAPYRKLPRPRQQQLPPKITRERLQRKRVTRHQLDIPNRQQRQQQILALEREIAPLHATLCELQQRVTRLRRLDEIEERLTAVRKRQKELGLETSRLLEEHGRLGLLVMTTPTKVGKEQH